MGWGARTLKAIGVVTAVISLVLGIQQIVTRVAGSWRQHREATAQIEVARQQAARGEFAQAWSSLDRAAALSTNEAVSAARVDVAFAWLQDARPGPGRPFSTITDAVTPALDHALITAQPERRADIVAHLGWATFLRLRDGVTGDPAARYQEALAIDQGNAFANAMLGHWLMWRGGASHAFVRRLQLAALVNRGGDADTELLRVASAMREHGEALDGRTADSLYAVYAQRHGPGASAPRGAGDALVPAASLALYEWVLQTPGSTTRSPVVTAFVRSALQEAAGDRGAALATLRDLQEHERLAPPVRAQVQQSVVRLSAPR